MAEEAGEAPAPVEEVEMSVLDALKEVSADFVRRQSCSPAVWGLNQYFPVSNDRFLKRP